MDQYISFEKGNEKAFEKGKFLLIQKLASLTLHEHVNSLIFLGDPDSQKH